MSTTPVICTAAHMRDTHYELRSLKQKSNGWMVVCSDRRAEPVRSGNHIAAVQIPELYIHEDEFTQEEHDTIAEALTLLENGFERRYDIHAGNVVERTKEHVATLLQTNKEIADAKAAHADVQQSLDAKRAAAEAEQALIDLQLVEKRVAAAVEHAALDAALVQKRAEASHAAADTHPSGTT